MRKIAYVSVALLVVFAGVGAASASAAVPAEPTAPAGATESAARPVAAGATTAASEAGSASQAAPPDPEEDVLGWENGVWYNESIGINASGGITEGDGLNASELDTVVARSMARVEKVRQLEFTKDIPVEIISRAEFRNQTTGGSSSPVPSRIHQNVKYEATFMINESADALETLRSNTAATVAGYYSPSKDKIVVIAPTESNASSLRLDEFTLAHELAHAVQDQHFDISEFFGNTTEMNNALSGVVEGDAHYTEYLYLEKCRSGTWACLKQPDAGGGGGGGDIHVGVFVISYVPYSEGQEFVKYFHEKGGWEAVNDLYANPPASTEQLIHREKYPGDEPQNVTIEDTSSGKWHILDIEGPTDHAVFGEAGLYSMMWYASYEASSQAGAAKSVVVGYRDFFEYKVPGGDELEDIGPYDYASTVTDGWDGDRLQPYVKGNASADAPTGYVWKTEWDTKKDARQFARGYRQLLQYHGAEQVGKQTWRIPEGEEFADAFHVIVDGTTVTIVNAPTVDQLSKVHAAVSVEEMDTSTPTPSPTPSPTPTDASTSTETTNATSTGTGTATGTGSTSPGFGLVAAVLALFAALALVRRRD